MFTGRFEHWGVFVKPAHSCWAIDKICIAHTTPCQQENRGRAILWRRHIRAIYVFSKTSHVGQFGRRRLLLHDRISVQEDEKVWGEARGSRRRVKKHVRVIKLPTKHSCGRRPTKHSCGRRKGAGRRTLLHNDIGHHGVDHHDSRQNGIGYNAVKYVRNKCYCVLNVPTYVQNSIGISRSITFGEIISGGLTLPPSCTEYCL